MACGVTLAAAESATTSRTLEGRTGLGSAGRSATGAETTTATAGGVSIFVETETPPVVVLAPLSAEPPVVAPEVSADRNGFVWDEEEAPTAEKFVVFVATVVGEVEDGGGDSKKGFGFADDVFWGAADALDATRPPPDEPAARVDVMALFPLATEPGTESLAFETAVVPAAGELTFPPAPGLEGLLLCSAVAYSPSVLWLRGGEDPTEARAAAADERVRRSADVAYSPSVLWCCRGESLSSASYMPGTADTEPTLSW